MAMALVTILAEVAVTLCKQFAHFQRVLEFPVPSIYFSSDQSPQGLSLHQSFSSVRIVSIRASYFERFEHMDV
jgi:hypothetical protein